MPLNLQYFKNPYGKGVSVGQVGTLREGFELKYFKSIQNDIVCDVGKEEKLGTYIFKYKLPSESNPEYEKKLFYDVVFYFEPVTDEMKSATRTLNDYNLYAYSNQINFIYTYTYVMNKPQNKHLIPWIPYRYYNKDAIMTAPVSRNPDENIYFDKSLWFCMFHLMQNRFNDKVILEANVNSKITRRYVLDNISTQNQKLEERRYFDKNLKIKKQKDVDRNYDKQKYSGIRNKREFIKKSQLEAKNMQKNMAAKKAKGLQQNLRADLKGSNLKKKKK